jgi:ribonucleoside-diphosphate reductase alpha chain
MAGDFLKTYKYGWKTSYYQNTYDNKDDLLDAIDEKPNQVQDLLSEILETEEDDCDSCKI